MRQFMPIEKIVAVFGNRYIALNQAAHEVRRLIEAINKRELEMPGSPYYQALRRLVDSEVEYEEVVEPEA